MPRYKDGEEDEDEDEACALFKHSQSLEAEDVWRMKVVAGMYADVGIAAEGYMLRGSYVLLAVHTM